MKLEQPTLHGLGSIKCIPGNYPHDQLLNKGYNTGSTELGKMFELNAYDKDY